MSVSSKIPSFSIIVIAICLSLIGIALIPKLTIKLSPSRELPYLYVSFRTNSSSPRIVESEVTSPLEAVLNRINGISSIESYSTSNGGTITITLDKHTNLETARFEASTIIRQTWPNLPQGTSYPYISFSHSDDESTRPFLVYSLNAPSSPLIIQEFAEKNIKPVISQIKGVSNVEIIGATQMQWMLEYDYHQLNKLGISVGDIQIAIQNHTSNHFLGIVPFRDKFIRVINSNGENTERFTPSEIPVKAINGNIVTLDKITTLSHVEEEPYSYYRINGLNSINMLITADNNSNQLKVGNIVKEQLESLKKQFPPEYEIHKESDDTEVIDKELNTIYIRTIVTIIILLLFVVLITLNLRYIIVIVTSLIANIAIAVIFYYLFDLEIQKYSLAGITISLNLIIDNIIVMSDHILHHGNRKVFMSILAATATTVGALSIIFFLEDENLRKNLIDFSLVIIINLVVSILIAMFLTPAIIDKIEITRYSKGRQNLKRKSIVIHLTHYYERYILFIRKHKFISYVVLILGFGLPVSLLPDHIENREDNVIFASIYNSAINSRTFNKIIKPFFGGTLRLFIEDTYSNGWSGDDSENINDRIQIYASLPTGSTLKQMDDLISKMEAFLTGFKEIKQIQSNIRSTRANINVLIKKEHSLTSFPYLLKSQIIRKAVTLGGGSWAVQGLDDQRNFNNDVSEFAGNVTTIMYGYNYDELLKWAEIYRENLMRHPRFRNVEINAFKQYYKNDYTEYYLDINKDYLRNSGVHASYLKAAVEPLLLKDLTCSQVYSDGVMQNITLTSKQSRNSDAWSIFNSQFNIQGKSFKLSDFSTIEKRQTSREIARENQQYRLYIQGNYLGTNSYNIQKEEIEEINKQLPVGYIAYPQNYRYSFGEKDSSQYYLLFVIIAIIYFITSILFNSLKQPFYIIMTIPISYIGAFLSYYVLGVKFNSGCFASFVLLCGITVNASIYLINEFNNVNSIKKTSSIKAYTKAWNHKIIPILLTIFSTIIGFIPFVVGNNSYDFWFSLAVGTIGGLVMSLIGIFLFLPMFVLTRKND